MGIQRRPVTPLDRFYEAIQQGSESRFSPVGYQVLAKKRRDWFNLQNQQRLILNGLATTNSDFDIDLTGRNWYDSSGSLDEPQATDSSMVKDIQEVIQTYQCSYHGPSSPIMAMIEEAIGSAIQSKNSGDLSAFLNSPSSLDNGPIRSNVQENELLEMSRKSKCVKPLDLDAINSESPGSNQQCTDATKVTKCVDKIKTVTSETKLLEALLAMERRLQQLQSQADEWFFMD